MENKEDDRIKLEELPVTQRFRIGLVVDFLNSEFTDFLSEGVKACGRKMGADVFVFQAGELQNKSSSYDYQHVAMTAFLTQNNIDGLIFVSNIETHYIDFEVFKDYLKSFSPIPIVNIAGAVPGIPSVIVDYEEAYSALIEHVIADLGVKKPAVMSVAASTDDVVLREKIIKDVFSHHNIDYFSVQKWYSDFSYSGAIHELNSFMEKSPDTSFDYDAIIALNDEMALGCMDFLKELGKKVPEDVIVTGFDDGQKSAINNPGLSTINQRVFEQGYVAARTLYDLLIGKSVPALQTIECKAVLRQSTNATAFIHKIRNDEYMEIDRAALAGTGIVDISASEWYKKRTEVYRVARCYMDIQADVTEDEMVKHLISNIQSFGIPYISVVLYEKAIEMPVVFDYFNLPSKAAILLSVDLKKGTTFNGIKSEYIFNPKDCILPKDFLRFNENPLIIIALFNGPVQYGYMAVEKTNLDIAVYDLLARTVSSLVTNIYNARQTAYLQSQLKERLFINQNIALTDELTGLFNRYGLFELGQKTLALSKDKHQTGLVVYADIDNLKAINNSLGHETGDLVLKAQAEILKQAFRINDVVSRISSDEFAIVCPGLSATTFVNVKNRIESQCEEWSRANNLLLTVTMTMGYVEYPSPECEYELLDLLNKAKADLFEKKSQKKN